MLRVTRRARRCYASRMSMVLSFSGKWMAEQERLRRHRTLMLPPQMNLRAQPKRLRHFVALLNLRPKPTPRQWCASRHFRSRSHRRPGSHRPEYLLGARVPARGSKGARVLLFKFALLLPSFSASPGLDDTGAVVEWRQRCIGRGAPRVAVNNAICPLAARPRAA
jgi:hypothetical protein